MENLGYLLAAYTVIWAAVFGYIFFIHRKQKGLQRQIDMLQGSSDKSKNNR
jgi:CcmD family protein